MGTNFYCREKISKKSRTQIRSLLDDLSKRIENADESVDIANMYDSCKESIEEYIPEEIHLGKRSCGWQFLWDYHNGKYYEANLESIKKYLSDKIIYDEYGRIFTIDQFFNDEIKYCLHNKDGKLEDGTDYGSIYGYSSHYFKSNDGLRFSIDEDFS